MLSCMNDVALMSYMYMYMCMYVAVIMRHHPSKDTRTCCLRPPPTGLSRAMDGSDDYV